MTLLPCPFAAAQGCAASTGPGEVVSFPSMMFLVSSRVNTRGDATAPTIAVAVEFAAAATWLFVEAALSTACRTVASSP